MAVPPRSRLAKVQVLRTTKTTTKQTNSKAEIEPERLCGEGAIQRLILVYLHSVGIFAWRNNTTGLYDVRSGAFRHAPLKGISDILGILPDGRLLAIEVKAKNNKPTQDQTAFLNNIIKNNGIAFVAYCLNDVKNALQFN